jgi:hypothetical protein
VCRGWDKLCFILLIEQAVDEDRGMPPMHTDCSANNHGNNRCDARQQLVVRLADGQAQAMRWPVLAKMAS